jgi:hypothetical protein
VPIDRIGAEVISAGKRGHGHATGQTEVDSRAPDAHRSCRIALQFRPFEINRTQKNESLSPKSMRKNLKSSQKRAAIRATGIGIHATATRLRPRRRARTELDIVACETA